MLEILVNGIGPTRTREFNEGIPAELKGVGWFWEGVERDGTGRHLAQSCL